MPQDLVKERRQDARIGIAHAGEIEAWWPVAHRLGDCAILAVKRRPFHEGPLRRHGCRRRKIADRPKCMNCRLSKQAQFRHKNAGKPWVALWRHPGAGRHTSFRFKLANLRTRERRPFQTAMMHASLRKTDRRRGAGMTKISALCAAVHKTQKSHHSQQGEQLTLAGGLSWRSISTLRGATGRFFSRLRSALGAIQAWFSPRGVVKCAWAGGRWCRPHWKPLEQQPCAAFRANAFLHDFRRCVRDQDGRTCACLSGIRGPRPTISNRWIFSRSGWIKTGILKEDRLIYRHVFNERKPQTGCFTASL